MISLLVVSGCTSSAKYPLTLPAETQVAQENSLPWLEMSLTDVQTNQPFAIADFKGKPVLLESFAVWCPTCTKQQQEINKLHEEVGDAVISISLDTDPNEDELNVKEHIQRYGFSWRYAVASADFTKQLIDLFGIKVVNAPSAPVVLICADQSYRLLPSGVKTAEELKEEIEMGCLKNAPEVT